MQAHFGNKYFTNGVNAGAFWKHVLGKWRPCGRILQIGTWRRTSVDNRAIFGNRYLTKNVHGQPCRCILEIGTWRMASMQVHFGNRYLKDVHGQPCRYILELHLLCPFDFDDGRSYTLDTLTLVAWIWTKLNGFVIPGVIYVPRRPTDKLQRFLRQTKGWDTLGTWDVSVYLLVFK